MFNQIGVPLIVISSQGKALEIRSAVPFMQRRIELFNLPPKKPNVQEFLQDFRSDYDVGIRLALLSSISNCLF